MSPERAFKVSPSHLQRDAYLYVRQSTLRQVFENTESTQRQYHLRDQALALGWATDQLQVIDRALGKSGAERDRHGFQQLITDVSLGRAGMVMGLEVSRLARNSMDWPRLLELCALSDTLILDEDGLYDPAHFNDRLRLGMKGTLSEAELHVLRARLQGGARHKAQRGELKVPLPVGLLYDAEDRVILDPDQQVQKAIRLVFETFARAGSTGATVRWFRRHGLHFPRRLRHGVNKGVLVWGQLGRSRVLQTLHHPRYAGAFVCGRTRTRPAPPSTGASVSKPCPKISGGCFDPRAIPAISAGRRLRPINGLCSTMPKRTARSAAVRREKDRRCSKVSWCVVNVGTG